MQAMNQREQGEVLTVGLGEMTQWVRRLTQLAQAAPPLRGRPHRIVG
jgi:hypothetical protein